MADRPTIQRPASEYIRTLPKGRIGRAKISSIRFSSDWKLLPGHWIIPVDPQLDSKLELNSTDKIHYFAAFSGEWAKAIAKQVAYVKATDIAKSFVEKLKESPGKITLIEQKPAEIDSHKINEFDWSVSFEPYPALTIGLEDIARNSLLNKKGLILIFAQNIDKYSPEFNYINRLKKIAKIYNIQFEIKTQKIYVKNNTGLTGFEPHTILYLRTNPETQKKAELDILIDDAIYTRPEGTSVNKVITNLAKRLNLTLKELEESLARIRKLIRLRYFDPEELS